jgi:hypothetical protein
MGQHIQDTWRGLGVEATLRALPDLLPLSPLGWSQTSCFGLSKIS